MTYVYVLMLCRNLLNALPEHICSQSYMYHTACRNADISNSGVDYVHALHSKGQLALVHVCKQTQPLLMPLFGPQQLQERR